MAGFFTCLVLLWPGSASAQEAILTFGSEIYHESWTVWLDNPLLVPEKGSDWDDSEWGPAQLYRMEYSGQNVAVMAEYETAESLFPSLGVSMRQRYSLAFESRSGGYVSDGVYFGLRYYNFEFANPTQYLDNHDYGEATLGYVLHVNQTGPGPYANLRITSPTAFWLLLLTLFLSNSNNDAAVNLADFPLPLGLEMQADAGYRLFPVPVEIGVGYRFFYYSTFYKDDYGSLDYGRAVSGIMHGVFLSVKLDLPAGF